MQYQEVTNWISRLASGDDEAMANIFSRYFQRLVTLASCKMHGVNLAPRSGEDIALSALKSFCFGVREKRIEVSNEDDLWGFLFLLTVRKACAERRRVLSQKRGFGVLIRSESNNPVGGDGDTADIFENVVGREPSPALAVELAENGRELIALFDDQTLQTQIIERKLQGASVAEIAEELDLVPHTVFYHLKKIKERWALLSNAEVIVEMTFNRCGDEQIARHTELPIAWIQAVKRLFATLWERSAQSLDAPPECRALIRRLFDGAAVEAPLDMSAPSDAALSRIIETWRRLIKTEWRKPLVAAWNRFKKEAKEQ